jgi:hypothetical protein
MSEYPNDHRSPVRARIGDVHKLSDVEYPIFSVFIVFHHILQRSELIGEIMDPAIKSAQTECVRRRVANRACFMEPINVD